MCGIAGIYHFDSERSPSLPALKKAVAKLSKRGPDHQECREFGAAALGHARLSIIDTSAAAHQPFTSQDGRYALVFNGEIYNYAKLRQELAGRGINFQSGGDTEVLFQLLIHEGKAALEKLNGFFAFAFWDRETNYLLMARDRLGIKPLVWYQDENQLCFASEMKALLEMGIPKKIDPASLHHYFTFNYTPAPATMLAGVKRLLPGQLLEVKHGKSELAQYYKLPEPNRDLHTFSYDEAKQQLAERLEDAVCQRLVSDVPLGSFLSGGIDSSVIATLARRHTDVLHTFSIGYADEPFFDETKYAKAVAKKIGSEHTVFSLRNQDLYEHLHEVLDYIDEPFADSSALAVYILSKRTRQHVTVALSGDGADELFSGYNKHAAEYMVRRGGLKNAVAKAGSGLWKHLPQSRNSKAGNLFRQLDRFAGGLKRNAADRYWHWAAFMQPKVVEQLLLAQAPVAEMNDRKQRLTQSLQTDPTNLNHVLHADLQMVLPNDMLTKVDLMSMANSLEVRTPFLDHRLVDWGMRLPESYKINGEMRKRVVQDAFRDILPEELYRRNKHGFEVPLLKWFQGELRSYLEDDLLHPDFIREQGIFRPEAVKSMLQQLHSSNPGDTATHVWAMLVFQNWWRRYFC